MLLLLPVAQWLLAARLPHAKERFGATASP